MRNGSKGEGGMAHILYSNRSACHAILGNAEAALKDAEVTRWGWGCDKKNPRQVDIMHSSGEWSEKALNQKAKAAFASKDYVQAWV